METQAPGVSYFTVAAAENLAFFRCEPLAATMSTKGCAARWTRIEAASASPARAGGKNNSREAIDAALDSPCRRCPIGATHAGQSAIKHSAIFGARICPACRRGGLRMIHDRVCVGCYNRRREMASGRNARGHPPAETLKKRPLREVQIRIINGSWGSIRAAGGVVDMLEPIVQALRTTRSDLAFGFASECVPRQASLF